MKVAINTCYGGFGLSPEASKLLNKRKNLKGDSLIDPEYGHLWDIERHDPELIKVIEELGDKCNSRFGDIKIVEIPDGVDYTIEEYDGNEWIAEKHRTWS